MDFSTESVSNKRRKLDDAELDSGDDEGRLDRVTDDINGQSKEHETYDRLANLLDISIGRHPVPQPSDGEVWSDPDLVYQREVFGTNT